MTKATSGIITGEEHEALRVLVNGMSEAAEASDAAGVHGRALTAMQILNDIADRANEVALFAALHPPRPQEKEKQ